MIGFTFEWVLPRTCFSIGIIWCKNKCSFVFSLDLHFSQSFKLKTWNEQQKLRIKQHTLLNTYQGTNVIPIRKHPFWTTKTGTLLYLHKLTSSPPKCILRISGCSSNTWFIILNTICFVSKTVMTWRVKLDVVNYQWHTKSVIVTKNNHTHSRYYAFQRFSSGPKNFFIFDINTSDFL